MAFGLDGGELNSAGLMAVGSRLENEIAAAAYVAETGRDWVESLFIARSAFAEADKVFKRKADNTPLFAGAIELLQALAKAEVKVGILSADTTDNVQDFVERYELDWLVQARVGTDTGPGKPDPALFYRICEVLGVKPTSVLVVGDSKADSEMAQAGGAVGYIGVNWGWTKSTLHGAVDVLIDRFADIQIVDENERNR
jgi:phosphoglycolate phosphatase